MKIPKHGQGWAWAWKPNEKDEELAWWAQPEKNILLKDHKPSPEARPVSVIIMARAECAPRESCWNN